MITHAFFKALLFLGAGSVIHGMHDEQDMRRMGGLRKFMPITAVTFIVGWLAIAGVLPFAGLLVEGRDPRQGLRPQPTRCGPSACVAALLTAFYMTRQVWLVFYGEERWRGRRARPRPTTTARTATAAARVAVDHDAAAGRAGGPRDGRLRDQPAVRRARVPGEWLEPVVGGSEHVVA